jgi:hypothetical protein
VVALIYKKVTITHTQAREYALTKSDPEAGNYKDTAMPTMPLWYLDSTPAMDNYNYSGSRKVEYKLCLLAGTAKTLVDLGTVNISVSGHFNQSGTDKELKEMGNDPEAAQQTYEEDVVGPTFVVSGNRLYGVSINVGKDAVTYSYDIEEITGDVSPQHDSPVNIEDYNQYWVKKSRVVGAMNYFGITDSKEFLYAGNQGFSGTAGFPDKVMGVCYKVN